MTDGERIAYLEDLAKKALKIFKNCAVEAGVCVCGDPGHTHEYGNANHALEDLGQYSVRRWLERAKEYGL